MQQRHWRRFDCGPMTPIRSGKKKPKSPPGEEEQKGRRKKLFAKFPKKIHAEENGISNRQKCPSFISPLTVEGRGRRSQCRASRRLLSRGSIFAPRTSNRV